MSSRSKKKRKIHIFPTIPNIETTKDLRVGSVVCNVTRPQKTPERYLRLWGIWLKTPAALWEIGANRVQEVEFKENIFGHFLKD